MKTAKEEKALAKTDLKEPDLAPDAQVFAPATDIYEKSDAVHVRCDMPGVTLDQLDIRLENDELEIKGVQSNVRPANFDLLAGEYDTGLFRRKFSVPHQIDRDKIKARLHNGVLDIDLPKANDAKPRKIEIAAGG